MVVTFSQSHHHLACCLPRSDRNNTVSKVPPHLTYIALFVLQCCRLAVDALVCFTFCLACMFISGTTQGQNFHLFEFFDCSASRCFSMFEPPTLTFMMPL